MIADEMQEATDRMELAIARTLFSKLPRWRGVVGPPRRPGLSARQARMATKRKRRAEKARARDADQGNRER